MWSAYQSSHHLITFLAAGFKKMLAAALYFEVEICFTRGKKRAEPWVEVRVLVNLGFFHNGMDHSVATLSRRSQNLKTLAQNK